MSIANNPKTINTVALRNYVKEISPTSLIAFLLSTPTKHKARKISHKKYDPLSSWLGIIRNVWCME